MGVGGRRLHKNKIVLKESGDVTDVTVGATEPRRSDTATTEKREQHNTHENPKICKADTM